MIQFFQEDELKLLYFLVNLIEIFVPFLNFLLFLALLQTEYRLFEVGDEVGMNIFDRFIFYILYEVFNRTDAISKFIIVQRSSSGFEFDYHKFLPIIECLAVTSCCLFVVLIGEKLLKYVNKLCFHQEIAHSFDDVMVTSSWKEHVINAFLAERDNNADDKVTKYVEIAQQLKDGILREAITDGFDDGRLPYFTKVQSDGYYVETKTDSQYEKELVLHGILAMHKSLQPQTVYQYTQPYEFVYDLLYTKSQLLILLAVGVSVNINKSEEEVFVIRVRDQYGYDFEEADGNEEGYQEVLMFEEFEEPCFAARDVDFMCIYEPQTAHEIKDVETTIKCVEEGAVDVLKIAPVAGEVVVGVGERVDDELHGDAGDHHDAQHWRPFLHGIVVLENEPFRAYAYAYCQDDQHETDGEVNLAVNLLVEASVVVAPAKQLDAVFAHSNEDIYIYNVFTKREYVKRRQGIYKQEKKQFIEHQWLCDITNIQTFSKFYQKKYQPASVLLLGNQRLQL